MTIIPRTLVPFDLRKLPVIDTDVLIVGSGSAALRAALSAARHRRSVLVVTKKRDRLISELPQRGWQLTRTLEQTKHAVYD